MVPGQVPGTRRGQMSEAIKTDRNGSHELQEKATSWMSG